MFWLSLAAIVVLIGLLHIFGIKSQQKADAERARLKSLPNYGRMCLVVDKKGRELLCRVWEWNIEPGKSKVWCVDPMQHPNGWTQNFIWPNEEIELLGE
jgi:hypothetical protein